MSAPILRQVVSGQIQYLQARHAVLTGNLANADTPGYAPKDIAAPNFAGLVERANRRHSTMSLSRTSSDHLNGSASTRADDDIRSVDGFEVSPSGNAVIVEEQAQKLQETRLQYELVTGIYTKLRGIRRTALGNNGA